MSDVDATSPDHKKLKTNQDMEESTTPPLSPRDSTPPLSPTAEDSEETTPIQRSHTTRPANTPLSDSDEEEEVQAKAKPVTNVFRASTLPNMAARLAEEDKPQPTTPISNNNNNKPPVVDKSRSDVICEVQLEESDITLQIRHGDITGECVGAIVNAANGHLMHGGGVAGAIVRKGGDVIQRESDAWIRKHGSLENGEVAVTGAGRLPCQYVIHAVGPIWRGGDRGEPKELEDAVMNSLLQAHKLNLDSISIPAISSGIFGFPKEQCAEIMIGVAIKFAKEHPSSSLKQIRYTNFDSETVEIFEAEFNNVFQIETSKPEYSEEEEEENNEWK